MARDATSGDFALLELASTQEAGAGREAPPVPGGRSSCLSSRYKEEINTDHLHEALNLESLRSAEISQCSILSEHRLFDWDFRPYRSSLTGWAQLDEARNCGEADFSLLS